MKRRDVLRRISGGTLAAAGAAMLPDALTTRLHAQDRPASLKGLPPLKITDIQTIFTAPNRIRLVVVKVVTSEPGLVGYGCATFTQRALVVQTAVEQYQAVSHRAQRRRDRGHLAVLLRQLDWRNGGVLFNAMSGVDIALWDIKGKRANMPLYQLLGGKVRHGADCYYHASGRDFQEVEDNARKGMAAGFRHVRVQGAVPGLSTYGTRSTTAAAGTSGEAIGPTNPGAIWESGPYVRMLPKLFEHLRAKLGEEVECSTTSTSACS